MYNYFADVKWFHGCANFCMIPTYDFADVKWNCSCENKLQMWNEITVVKWNCSCYYLLQRTLFLQMANLLLPQVEKGVSINHSMNDPRLKLRKQKCFNFLCLQNQHRDTSDNWVSPWLSCHPFSQYSPTGSTRSDERGWKMVSTRPTCYVSKHTMV